MVERVMVFIDSQNFYRNARRAFYNDRTDAYVYGQFRPWAVGEMLASRDRGRHLEGVRLYTGRPDATLQPKANGANLRQCSAWERAGCSVFHRPLRYPHGWPNVPRGERPTEKGIDVLMALDLVRCAYAGHYDVAIVCTGDTDLIPAIEEVLDMPDGPRVEVAGWRSPNHRQRLSLPGRNLWCHWLEKTDYDAVRDSTDYVYGSQ